MIAILICVVAFVVSYLAGRRSLGYGLIAALTVGYFYGIARANLLTQFSHFMFDASLVGLFLSQRWGPSPGEAGSTRAVRLWLLALIGWPILVSLMPFQPLLVSIVGLRGNTFFLPMLLLGSRLKERDLLRLAVGIAILNFVALGFAFAEYVSGVQKFYPRSPVTAIIYASNDAGEGFLRIPAIFVNAHAFGGTMVSTLPYLIGAWSLATSYRQRWLMLFAIGCSLLGILMSATRLNFIIGSGMILVTLFTSRMKAKSKVIFVLLVIGLGMVAISNVRFQRFMTLTDTDFVKQRIAGSVNRGFWEILVEHPMGNGVGGGGTSIPYFLEGQVRNPIGLESEYARILCELGVIGLVLWLSFLIWFISRGPIAFAKVNWQTARRLAWCLCILGWGSGLTGIGVLTSIPGTMIFLLSLGWTVTPQTIEVPGAGSVERRRPVFADPNYVTIYER
jgi:hypothetical protein